MQRERIHDDEQNEAKEKEKKKEWRRADSKCMISDTVNANLFSSYPYNNDWTAFAIPLYCLSITLP